eukprot:scaffold1405_cov92-Cylindrotheca_fusiformis.AAC.2
MQHPEVEDVAWIYNGKDEVPPTVRRVKIADTVTKIPDYAFNGYRELEEVILSSSVQVIGGHAFNGCWKLKSILYQGQEKEEVGIPSNVKVIDWWVFDGCELIENLVLNEGLEQIGEWAFGSLESLTEVDIPSTVVTIGEGAFFGCIRLERLGLNEGLERIGVDAFRDCRPLSHVRIPRSVNSIATTAFAGCCHLISIEVPEETSFIFNLSGILSLASLAGPESILFSDEDEHAEFFQSSKLGSLVDNEADLVHRLKHRFDNSPLNKLCYYQSYHVSEDVRVQLSSLMVDDPLTPTNQTDEFGMTPLHILSLAQTPNVDMLLAVMEGGWQDHMIFGKDAFGSTSMEYLCLNQMPNSDEVIRKVLLKRFDKLLGLDRSWKSEMLQAIDKALAVENSSRRRAVVAVYLQLATYERKEASSCLELCLCRVHSGTSFVIPRVLSYLDNLDVEAYFISYPDQFGSAVDVSSTF